VVDWPPDPDPHALDPDVLDVLIRLYNDSLSVPRAQRRFWVRRPLAAGAPTVVSGGGLTVPLEVASQDLRALRDERLINTERHTTRGTYEFFITPLGKSVVEDLKPRGEPTEEAEEEAVRYVDGGDFRITYPMVHAKLHEARALAASDPVGNATRIGHECREAMFSFADVLATTHSAAPSAGPEETVAKVRAVLEIRRAQLGGRTRALLDALLTYWGTVSDLTQRQEHGAKREGEPLTSEDSRRVVFYTALVMYELDRTLRDP
jgi:hypothetical protein